MQHLRYQLRSLATCCGIALFFLCAGCAGTSTVNAQDPFTGGGQPHHTGDVVHDGTQWDITITTIATHDGTMTDVLGGGHTFLVVSMAFTNKTSSSQSLYTVTQLTLRDAAGTRYTQTTTSFATPPDGPVMPTGTATGDIVFEVPQNQTHFTLAYIPDTGPSPIAWVFDS